MLDDWFDILQRGEFEVSVPTLSVTSDQIGALEGSARFSWNADSGIRIQAVTNGMETLMQQSDGRVGTPGQLISHTEYVTFSGLTQDGWNITADRMPLDGYRINTSLPDVSWDLNTTGLTLHRDSAQSEWCHRIFMGPCPPVWTRFTETEVRNEFFGGKSTTRDWLLFECSIGQVAARSRSDDWIEVRVIPHEGRPMCDASTTRKIVAMAFGFVLGRRCVIRGEEWICDNQVTRRISVPHHATTRNSLPTPLGRSIEFLGNVEQLLGATIDFFRTKLGERVIPFLYLCWDTADNSHLTQLAISSICVEGLIRVAAKSLGPTQPQADKTDIQAFKKWLETTPDGFSESFLKRLDGMSGNFSNLSPNEIFRNWEDRGMLGVTKQDRDAWSEIRNPSAHGGLSEAIDREELQTRITRHIRLRNLINRVLLQLIGYRGKYIDYSQLGYPAIDFPYVTLQGDAAASEVTPSE